MWTHSSSDGCKGDLQGIVHRRKCHQATTRAELAVAILGERIVIAVVAVVLAGVLVVVTQITVMLHPMHHGGWHMRPLVQVQYAEGVEGEGEGE